jgi:surface antigen
VGKSHYTLIAMSAAAALVSSCGIVPRVAQQTTAAAIAPISNTVHAVAQSLEVTSRNLAAGSMAAQRTARQVSVTAAQARTASRTRSRAAEQRRQQTERVTERNAALKERIENSAVEAEPFDILPAAILVQLSEHQAALQRAVQKEAFTAPIGETIFWEDSGRTGTAMTEDESLLGGFVCRTFVQTVRLEETEEQGRAFSCKSLDGVWEPPLTRTEFTP